MAFRLAAHAGRAWAVAGGLAVLMTSAAVAQTPPPENAEALFQRRCASCHDPNIERAPSRASLREMAPAQISGALESGVMAPMASGLSKDDIQMLAAHLGSTAQASAAQSAAATTAPVPSVPVIWAPPAEWRGYSGGYSSQHYSPLDQINKDTVAGLHVVWRQSLTPDAPRPKAAPPPSSNNETTPLMVGGRVYYSTGIGGVAALEADTGKLAWNLDPAAASEDAVSADDARQRQGGATRALSYYDDGGDGRIIALMGGNILTALNAKTGKRIASFGANGQVDLRKGQDPRATGFIWRTGPTVIVRGVIIIGSVVNDINAARGPQKKTQPPGDVRGIDVKTGKQLWIWH
ncbi:MAG TPA: PQQ-binding-like beta-propeller repeat protein, partial [Hyphomonadaceae bacterium]|nr:PQQ-binding-like beta-propeller repeat protein [Hyphomonadaceae bacterium]